MKIYLFSKNPLVIKIVESGVKAMKLPLFVFEAFDPSFVHQDDPLILAFFDDSIINVSGIPNLPYTKILFYKKSGIPLKGFDHYIRKPFLPTEIVEYIKSRSSQNFHPGNFHPNTIQEPAPRLDFASALKPSTLKDNDSAPAGKPAEDRDENLQDHPPYSAPHLQDTQDLRDDPKPQEPGTQEFDEPIHAKESFNPLDFDEIFDAKNKTSQSEQTPPELVEPVKEPVQESDENASPPEFKLSEEEISDKTEKEIDWMQLDKQEQDLSSILKPSEINQVKQILETLGTETTGSPAQPPMQEQPAIQEQPPIQISHFPMEEDREQTASEDLEDLIGDLKKSDKEPDDFLDFDLEDGALDSQELALAKSQMIDLPFEEEDSDIQNLNLEESDVLQALNTPLSHIPKKQEEDKIDCNGEELLELFNTLDKEDLTRLLKNAKIHIQLNKNAK